MFLNDCLGSGCVKAGQHPNTRGNVGGLGGGNAAQCEFSSTVLFLHENHLEKYLCKSWVIHIILFTGEDGGGVGLLWLDQHQPWTRSNTCSHLAHRGGLQDQSHQFWNQVADNLNLCLQDHHLYEAVKDGILLCKVFSLLIIWLLSVVYLVSLHGYFQFESYSL